MEQHMPDDWDRAAAVKALADQVERLNQLVPVNSNGKGIRLRLLRRFL